MGWQARRLMQLVVAVVVALRLGPAHLLLTSLLSATPASEGLRRAAQAEWQEGAEGAVR